MTNQKSTIERWLIALFALMFGISSHAADSASATPSYKAVDGQPIISFYQSHGMVANSDIHSQVEVFGDGRVRVFVPEYKNNPGTYEYLLSQKSLNAIVSRLDYFGLMRFDTNTVRNTLTQEQRQQEGITYAVLDATTTSVVLNFEQYSTSHEKAQELKRTLVWDEIGVDAKRYPQIEALSGLANAEKLLLSLADHQRRDSKRVNGGQ